MTMRLRAPIRVDIGDNAFFGIGELEHKLTRALEVTDDALKTVCTVWVAATSDEVHSTQGLLGAQGDSQRLGKRGE